MRLHGTRYFRVIGPIPVSSFIHLAFKLFDLHYLFFFLLLLTHHVHSILIRITLKEDRRWHILIRKLKKIKNSDTACKTFYELKISDCHIKQMYRKKKKSVLWADLSDYIPPCYNETFVSNYQMFRKSIQSAEIDQSVEALYLTTELHTSSIRVRV